jgi:hypothetical protein
VRIAFQVQRANFYRLYAPIVDEALREGWDVECWHDYSQARHGQKGYNFPAVESAPRFVNGAPKFRTYQGLPELHALQQSTDAVVSLLPSPFEPEANASRSPATWFMLQHAMSNFQGYGPDGFRKSDVVGVYSEHWAQLALEFFREKGVVRPGDGTEQQIDRKARAVGFPEMEAASLIDPREVRRRLGIPADKPVVVVLPYSYGFGLSSFRVTHRHQQCTRWGEARSLVRQLWADLNVVKAVRAFASRNGTHLVVKSRMKRRPMFYTRALADTHLYDDSVYPATILEILKIASVCIGFYSTTVHEAAYLGVPYVCLRPSDRDVRGPRALQRVFMDRSKSSWDFPGVSTVLEVPDAIASLPRSALDDFKIDAQARATYVEKFLGYDDGRSSKRVLDEVRRETSQEKGKGR